MASNKCPNCAENIQREAAVCKHCGKDISVNKSKSKKSKSIGCLSLLLVIFFIVICAQLADTDESGNEDTNIETQEAERLAETQEAEELANIPQAEQFLETQEAEPLTRNNIPPVEAIKPAPLEAPKLSNNPTPEVDSYKLIAELEADYYIKKALSVEAEGKVADMFELITYVCNPPTQCTIYCSPCAEEAKNYRDKAKNILNNIDDYSQTVMKDSLEWKEAIYSVEIGLWPYLYETRYDQGEHLPAIVEYEYSTQWAVGLQNRLISACNAHIRTGNAGRILWQALKKAVEKKETNDNK